jgi:hypothetical protein
VEYKGQAPVPVDKSIEVNMRFSKEGARINECQNMENMNITAESKVADTSVKL